MGNTLSLKTRAHPPKPCFRLKKKRRVYTPALNTLAWLQHTFPHCFSHNKLPLKIGIHHDVIRYCQQHHPQVSRTVLRKAVSQYARGNRYLRGIQAGQARVDLEGAPYGIVTQAEAVYAQQQLQQRKARMTPSAVPTLLS